MGSIAFHQFLRLEQSFGSAGDQSPQPPQAAVSQVDHVYETKPNGATRKTEEDRIGPSESPSGAELDDMPIGPGASYQGPLDKPPAAFTQVSMASEWMQNDALSPASYARSRLASSFKPTIGEPVDVLQTFYNPPITKWRVFGACLTLLAQGMNDSAPGALLQSMEHHYDIGYALVSLIFIGNAIGFILAAFFVHALDKKLGRSRTLMVCDVALIAAYAAMAATPPFPVFVLAFVVTGWAMASCLALHNVFCANLANATMILGAIHGSYGIGGIIAPIIATTMVKSGVLFSRFYIIEIGLRTINLIFGGWAFRNFEHGNSPVEMITPPNHSGETQPNGAERRSAKQKSLRQALKNRTTIIGALFIFAYQGAEVAISGWVISFLINYRGSAPGQVGYVTAGFWGGITLGRFLLSYAAHRVGEKAFTYGLVAGALGFQLFVWFLPNVIADSVGIALLGLLLGPIYPAASSLFTRLLPRGLQNTAMAFVSSAGSTGGAVAPFLTGILAQAAGTWVLHPICISLFVLMELCWFCLPTVEKRSE